MLKTACLSLLCIVSGFLYATGNGDKENPYAVKTVVIDAGHGGHDRGCSGAFSNEKHVALSVALKLGKYIESNIPGTKVIYTRKTDKFIELHERAAIANRNNADLFISIHCNASTSKSPHGTETYVMGLHKTEANLQVAKRENDVILLEDGYNNHYDGFDPSSPTAHIIFRLFQNAYLEQSILIASLVEQQFKNRVNRHSRGVKQAGFLVLYRTAMPSVLIETGFLSNNNEEIFLNSADGQDYMASAMFRAFRDYKKTIEEKHLLASNATVSTAPIISDSGIKTEAVKEDIEQKTAPAREEIAEVAEQKINKEPEVKKEVEVKAKPIEEKKEDVVEIVREKQIEAPKPETKPSKEGNSELFKDTEPIVIETKPAEKPVKKTTATKAEVKNEVKQPVKEPATQPTEMAETFPVAENQVIFKVQFLASKNKYSMTNSKFRNLGNEHIVEIINAGGLYKYLTGGYFDMKSAINVQNKLRRQGYSDAFIVAYQNDVRITLKKARAILGIH